jgi:hypothetical protein
MLRGAWHLQHHAMMNVTIRSGARRLLVDSDNKAAGGLRLYCPCAFAPLR